MQQQQQPQNALTTEPGYSEKQQMLNQQPALQQQQIQYQQVMPLPIPNQQLGQNQNFAKLQNEKSVTFIQKTNCGSWYCPCYPKYSFNQTYRDREVGQEIFKAHPTKNCCGWCYQTEIKSLSDVTLLKSQRPSECCGKKQKKKCCSCCDDILLFVSEGSGIQGKQTLPAIARYCMVNGQFVHVQGQKKYFIGQGKEGCCGGFCCGGSFCCGEGESMSSLDIWNPERTERLGTIYYIVRTKCCSPLAVLSSVPCCKPFCMFEKRWFKITFPEYISVEDKAMLMAAVSNGYGESMSCCIPYD